MLKNVHVFKKNLGSVEKICNLNYSACNSSMWKTPSASLSSALISTLRVIQHGPLAPLPARVPAVVLCARSVKAGLLAPFAGLRPPRRPSGDAQVRAALLVCRLVVRLLFPSILFSAPARPFRKYSFADSLLLVSQDPAQLQEASPQEKAESGAPFGTNSVNCKHNTASECEFLKRLELLIFVSLA